MSLFEALALEEASHQVELEKDFETSEDYDEGKSEFDDVMDSITTLEEMKAIIQSELENGGMTPSSMRFISIGLESAYTLMEGKGIVKPEVSLESYSHEYNNLGASLKTIENIELSMEGLLQWVGDKLVSLCGSMGKEIVTDRKKVRELKAQLKKKQFNPDLVQQEVSVANALLFTRGTKFDPQGIAKELSTAMTTELLQSTPVTDLMFAQERMITIIQEKTKTNKADDISGLLEDIKTKVEATFKANVSAYWKSTGKDDKKRPLYEFAPCKGLSFYKGGLNIDVGLVPKGFSYEVHKDKTEDKKVPAPTEEDLKTVLFLIDNLEKIYDRMNILINQLLDNSKERARDFQRETRLKDASLLSIIFAKVFGNILIIEGLGSAFNYLSGGGHSVIKTIGQTLLSGTLINMGLKINRNQDKEIARKVDKAAMEKINREYEKSSMLFEKEMVETIKSCIELSRGYLVFVQAYTSYVLKGVK